MTNARKIELLKVVLKTLKLDPFYTRGICFHIITLWASDDCSMTERGELEEWFNQQKPRRRVNYEFTKHHSFTNGGWWWRKDIDGHKQRILFVEHLINQLEND